MLDTTYAAGSPPARWAWLLLFKAPAVALGGRVCLLAAVGVMAVGLCDSLTGTTATRPPDRVRLLGEPADQAIATLATVWQAFVQPFVEVARGEAIAVNLIGCLARVAIWALLGGGIARIAALRFTRDETTDVPGAVGFAWRNKSGFAGGPLLLLAGLLAVSLPLLAVRFAMQISWFAPVAAVLWPLVMVAAAVATLYGIAAAAGWPMLWAASAADNADAFDAVSRLFAYFYQKPLRLLGYLGVTVALGLFAAFGLQLFTNAVLAGCTFAAGATTSPWAMDTAAWWQSVATQLVTVYLTAYLWTSAAAIYLLRRQDVDGVHTDEVFLYEEEFAGGLPGLNEDDLGMPVVDKQACEAA